MAHRSVILSDLTAHTRLHVMALLAAHPALTPTSGRRSPQRNRAVGGVPSSYHLTGRACDFSGSRDLIRRAARTAKAQRVTPRCTGPEEVVDEGDHLHVAW